MTEAFIYDAVRSPRGKGRSDGSLHEITALDLASQVWKGMKSKTLHSGAYLPLANKVRSSAGQQFSKPVTLKQLPPFR